MNFANPPFFILLFAVVYLLSIYGLLAMAQINNQGNSTIINSRKNTSN